MNSYKYIRLWVWGMGVLILGVVSGRAEFSATNSPYPGITYYAETRVNPPTRLFVAVIDLTNAAVHLRVTRGGPDPDGAGKWQTTLMPPTEVAEREHFDLVVNGDFFIARHVKDAEGKQSGYRAGQWSYVEGTAMTDGNIWSVAEHPRPCLVVHTNRTVTLEPIYTRALDDWEVISGNTMLVNGGIDVAPADKMRHPRTVVGLDASGTKLILLVVDGRKPEIAIGMSYEELAQEMLKLGAHQALNLDGGGSSVMAIRDAATDKMNILNQPTDGRERAVADVLGVKVMEHQ